MQMERVVSGKEHEIRYILEQKPVKNLNLRIRKDGGVYVSANPNVPVQIVDEFVEGKENYICNAREKFLKMVEYAPKPKQYISGESFTILGRGLRLQVEQANKEEVYSDGVYIFLRVKDTDDFQRKERLVTRFLDQQCQNTFREVVSSVYPTFQKYGVVFPTVKIRSMDTRWGSCIAGKGIITLNKRLLEAPMHCIEYVVMHEFCHFIHPDHSKKFYALLTMFMPDWKERKAVLEKTAEYGL